MQVTEEGRNDIRAAHHEQIQRSLLLKVLVSCWWETWVTKVAEVNAHAKTKPTLHSVAPLTETCAC